MSRAVGSKRRNTKSEFRPFRVELLEGRIFLDALQFYTVTTSSGVVSYDASATPYDVLTLSDAAFTDTHPSVTLHFHADNAPVGDSAGSTNGFGLRFNLAGHIQNNSVSGNSITAIEYKIVDNQLGLDPTYHPVQAHFHPEIDPPAFTFDTFGGKAPVNSPEQELVLYRGSNVNPSGPGVLDAGSTFNFSNLAFHAAQTDLSGVKAPAVRDFTITIYAALKTATQWVTNRNDSGDGSLRQAILNANSDSNTDRIKFDLPPLSVIKPLSSLPAITSAVVVDGSLPDGTPGVILDGSLAGVNAVGLQSSGIDADAFFSGFNIQHFDGAGVLFRDTSLAEVNNSYIGTDISGGHARGNGVGIGFFNVSGADVIACTISGNTSDGVYIDEDSTNIALYQNRIGVSASADSFGIVQPVGNGQRGILCVGHNNVIGDLNNGNIIGGNGTYGIEFVPGDHDNGGFKNTVQGNSIGVGFAPRYDYLPNGLSGIAIHQIDDNVIDSNTIFFNHKAGIELWKGGNSASIVGNRITRNSIAENHFGIDLEQGPSFNQPEDPGPTPNDSPDLDGLQNFPVLDTGFINDGMLTLTAELHSRPGNYVIEYFASLLPDQTRYGQGEHYLGTSTVTADAQGNVTFTAQVPAPPDNYHYITATATRVQVVNQLTPPRYTTSEFSQVMNVFSFASVANGILQVTGTLWDDDIVITRMPDGSTQVTLNGQTQVIPGGLVTSTNVQGGSGADTLTIDFGAGNPVPGGLTYDGGGGGDRLVLKNGSTSQEISSATDPGAGSVTFDGSTITYSNLTPLDDTVAATDYAFNATGGDDQIQIVDGPLANGAATMQIASGNGAFELQNIANKTNVTINGLGGADTFTLGKITTPAGLTSLTLNGQDGDDTFNISASGDATINIEGGIHVTPAGDALNFNGQGLAYTFTGNKFTSASLQPVNYQNVETVGLSDGTYNSTGAISPAVVVGTGATLAGSGSILGPVTSNAGGTVAPGVGAGHTAIINTGVLTLNAASTYTVDVNGEIPGSQYDQLVVSGDVVLNNPTLAANVTVSTIPGDAIVIIDNPGAGTVTGNFLGLPQGALLTLGTRQFTIDYTYDSEGDGRDNDVALVRFGAALAQDPCDRTRQALFVSATAGPDNIQVVPYTGSSRMQVFINGASQGIFAPTGHLIVFGQSGDDLINVTVPHVSAYLYGGNGNDTIRSGNGDSFLIGGDGNDSLYAGNGKDILVGGRGSDYLVGGNGKDVLVTGSTIYDGNSNANRVALATGGTSIFSAITVFDDGAPDTALGGNGQDIFFLHRANDLSDALGGESVTNI
ncbi:MAG TPA: hypothetical protein VIM11_19270 [Tepidisphaeraceae bacterium]|jgi:Ca2+-binding RTX toxin-like protein